MPPLRIRAGSRRRAQFEGHYRHIGGPTLPQGFVAAETLRRPSRRQIRPPIPPPTPSQIPPADPIADPIAAPITAPIAAAATFGPPDDPAATAAPLSPTLNTSSSQAPPPRSRCEISPILGCAPRSEASSGVSARGPLGSSESSGSRPAMRSGERAGSSAPDKRAKLLDGAQ